MFFVLFPVHPVLSSLIQRKKKKKNKKENLIGSKRIKVVFFFNKLDYYT